MPANGIAFFLLLLFCGSSKIEVGQDSLNCKGYLHVRVIDDHFERPITNAKIEVHSVNGRSTSALTNDSGFVVIELPARIGTPEALFVLSCAATEMMTAKDQLVLIDAPCQVDTTIARTYTLRWAGPCIDTFAPGFIPFEKDQVQLPDSMVGLLESWAALVHEFIGSSNGTRIEVFGSSGYDEEVGVAKERVDHVHRILTDAGVNDSLIIEAVIGHGPFYYCTHCEGCIPKWQYGEGYLLAEDQVGLELDSAELNNLRRVIRVSYVNKDSPTRERTLKPRIE